MENKEVETHCPCCGEVLLVDVRTGKVLRHHPAPKDLGGMRADLEEGRWEQAVGRVDGRKKSGSFDQAVEREQNREADLDDLFRKAQEKIDRRKNLDF